MPTRRCLLSWALGSAALGGGGLPAVDRASARSAAPEFVGIDGWLNTDGPLSIAGLRGKVVLVEFCTYTCINWRRTLPYVKRWHSEYGPQGLQIIGVHTPEFGFERVRRNVESAIRELEVRWPIAQDNEFQTWRAWDNRGVAVVLSAGPGWTGCSGSRRRGTCPGDRGRDSRPAGPCARRRRRTSGGRCRPVAHRYTRDLLRVAASRRGRTARSRRGKARQSTPSSSPAVPN